MQMSFQNWALLFFLSLLWGGSFFFATIAVRELPPLTLVMLRTGIAALALTFVLRIQGEKWPFATGAISAFFVMGFLNNLLPFSLLFWAQTKIPSGLASILNATTPIFSIMVAHVLLADERLAVNKLIGIVFGFTGVVVLLGAGIFNASKIGLLAMLACLCAALCYGFASVFGRRFKAMHITATQVATGQLAATTLMIAPVVLAIDHPWVLPVPSLQAISAVLALALVSTALAYVIFFKLLASSGAISVSLVTLLIPVSAILLVTLVLGENLLMRHYVGMTLIGAGLLAIDGRIKSLWSRRT